MTTSLPHLSHPKYRPDIDGLRAVAVLSVVAFHAFPAWMKGGFIGVDVFFVISGFLISTIIFENLDKGTFSFSEFYARRIKRIFPALLVILVASYAFGWFVLLADEHGQLGKHIVAGAGFVSNLVFWSESGYFDNAADTKPLLHLWSLGIEEQFYIIWPLVLWLSWKRRFSLPTATIALAVVSFALNIKGARQDSVATFYSPQTRFWELLSGSTLAWFTLYKNDAYANTRSKINGWFFRAGCRENVEDDGGALSSVLSVFGCLLLIYGFWRINKTLSFPGYWGILPVLGSVLIILAGPKARLNRKVLSRRIVVWFGLISFPLYLWHWPLLSFARIVEAEAPGRAVRIAAVLVSVVLAWLTYKLVERPIRFGAHSRIKVMVLVAVMVGTAFLGSNSYTRDGLRFRSAASNTAQSRADLIKEAENVRAVEIRSGICHFNRQGKFKDVGSFVSNWSCFSDDEGILNTRTLVFGDSHSADKSVGLRLNGLDVVQLGGAGCSINPELATDQRSDCGELFRLLRRNQTKYDYIFLSNKFPPNEITEENLAGIFKYWSGPKTVYLFTPMPDFTAQMNEFVKSGKSTSAPDFSREDTFLRVAAKVGVPPNFRIVKTSEVWCSNRRSDRDYPCSFVSNGELLMVDGGHFSVAGSRVFGRNMISHPLLKPILSNGFKQESPRAQ